MSTSTYPRCQAKLKDGSPCRTHATDDSDLCAYHTRQLAAPPPGPLHDRHSASQEEQCSPAIADTNGQQRGVPVAEVRSQLAIDAAAEYELLRAALLDALKAQRDAFATCPHCHKRHPVEMPDWAARVKAVETVLNQGFGAKPEPTEHHHDRQLRDLRELLNELDNQERTVCGIAHNTHRLECQLRPQRQRKLGTKPPRDRLRRLVIELFELDCVQVELFHRLVNASPRVWNFPAELRQVIRVKANTP